MSLYIEVVPHTHKIMYVRNQCYVGIFSVATEGGSFKLCKIMYYVFPPSRTSEQLRTACLLHPMGHQRVAVLKDSLALSPHLSLFVFPIAFLHSFMIVPYLFTQLFDLIKNVALRT